MKLRDRHGVFVAVAGVEGMHRVGLAALDGPGEFLALPLTRVC